MEIEELKDLLESFEKKITEAHRKLSISIENFANHMKSRNHGGQKLQSCHTCAGYDTIRMTLEANIKNFKERKELIEQAITLKNT